MPWSRPEQRVLWVAAAFLFMFIAVMASPAVRDLPVFAIVQDDPGLDLRLDPNRASVEDLESLPGIGPALAAAIVAHRKERPFLAIADLGAVPGIGPATLRKLETYLRVR